MWDDVCIGGARQSGSAFKCDYDFGIHHISQNCDAYWITLENPRIGMTVYKNTHEGYQSY